jgi:NTP pyrophosphatase (non-canonical NTP hydrolase)
MKPSKTLAILTEVQWERRNQDRRFGEQNHSHLIWLGILAEEFGEVAREANDLHFKYPTGSPEYKAALRRYREELIQVAAVAVAMVECIERMEGPNLEND